MRIVGMHHGVIPRHHHRSRERQRLDAPPLPADRIEQRKSLARQQRGFHSGRGQTFDEPQHLPLAAAHFFARIQVENAHQLMFLAFAYFRNV